MTDKNPFSVKSKQSGERFVGAYLPQHIVDYLNLLAVYRQSTITNLLIELLGQYADNQEEPVDYLTRILAQRAYNEWAKRLKQNKYNQGWKDQEQVVNQYRKYEDEIRKTLHNRKVPEPWVTEIIQKMENMYGIGDVI